jgi:hypothetical protein
VRRVTVAGGDLYQLALVELGSALQWWRIAQANGITDPMLSGLNTLIIPGDDSSLTDGLPPQ